MSHTFYVDMSYGFAVLVVAALLIWTFADGRARKRELAALEASGIRRRSSTQPPATDGTAP